MEAVIFPSRLFFIGKAFSFIKSEILRNIAIRFQMTIFYVHADLYCVLSRSCVCRITNVSLMNAVVVNYNNLPCLHSYSRNAVKVIWPI